MRLMVSGVERAGAPEETGFNHRARLVIAPENGVPVGFRRQCIKLRRRSAVANKVHCQRNAWNAQAYL